ncbi:MAG: methylated-DNA--[protein]-cysteine S-methyltransferase [Treponema sp.]|nr:methylated-DNA--[protein]-cysteine S-methyltransferase [Treponema sp.]MCL2236888.1 methylated-DNA--[protein]-cysteine S-methyltransferase [Treponema sp.]
MKFYQFYSLGLCSLGIAEDEGAISNVFFGNNKPPKGFEKHETPLIKSTAAQLEEYFNNKRKVFNIPISFNGTPFKVKVWEALLTIPFGETKSYGEVAAMINKPKACRAVGMANNTNQIAIIIPCHRVIGHDGSLVGYAGGLEIKKKLLELERTAE